eukprot:COSAG02_NODE_6075_length_3821_cov_16.445401_1_plen_58_part_00
MPAKQQVSAEVAQLKTQYEQLYGKPPGGPDRNKDWWLNKKITKKKLELGIEEAEPPV